MLMEIGHYLLIVALLSSTTQAIMPGLARLVGGARILVSIAKRAAVLQCVLALSSLMILIIASVESDFSVLLVFLHSHSATHLIYKITGVWGSHEGSMLLFVALLSIAGALVSIRRGDVSQRFKLDVLGVQAWISSVFFLFILTTSNTFARLYPPPFEGRGLNPLLQDLGMVLHPPLLYIGYVGFSVVFSFAIAAMFFRLGIKKRWARAVRPWVLASWSSLTLGITIGSFWAYYELGWGGWWFWDPVENASLMPWLSGTALLHSVVASDKRKIFHSLSLALTILTFSLSLLSMFLVRSGIVTSVHAFALDSYRGVFILAIFSVFVGGSSILYLWRRHTIRTPYSFTLLTREGGTLFNTLVLLVSCFAVLLGTLFPLFVDSFSGDRISVGAPYFNLVVGSMMLFLIAFVPIGSVLNWQDERFSSFPVKRLACAFLISILITWLLAHCAYGETHLLPLIISFVAIWVMIGTVIDPCFCAGFGSVKATSDIKQTNVFTRVMCLVRRFHFPDSCGKILAHFGLGVFLLGVVAESNWSQERIVELRPADSVELADYKVSFDGVTRKTGGTTFIEDIGSFTVRDDQGDVITVLTSSKRLFVSQQASTTEVGLANFGFSHLYVAMGEVLDDSAVLARIYYKPLVSLIWLGAILIALGGIIPLLRKALYGIFK